MSVAHVACAVSWGKEPGTPAPFGGIYNPLEPLPYEGWYEGDMVILWNRPVTGFLEHICVESYNGRQWRYAYVLWPDGGRRGDKTFDVHGHHYLFNLRLATDEHLAMARAVVENKLQQERARYGMEV